MPAELRTSISITNILVSLCTLMVTALASAGSAFADQKVTETHYVLHCSGCHRQDGRGSMKGRIPDFVNSIGNIARSEEGRAYIARVPGVKNSGLNEEETAAVLNYVLDRFGGPDMENAHYSEAEVKRSWSLPETDIAELRDYICRTSVPAGCSYYPWESRSQN